MTKAEYIERYGIEGYNSYKERNNERTKERYKNNSEYREYRRTYHKDYNKEHKEYHKEYRKEYRLNDLNYNGEIKDNIRNKTTYILFNKRHHTKLKDYEIHHCFGYEDPAKFIYIPRTLHYMIHQYLRDNKIDADSNHYEYIKYMLNDCEKYTYISV